MLNANVKCRKITAKQKRENIYFEQKDYEHNQNKHSYTTHAFRNSPLTPRVTETGEAHKMALPTQTNYLNHMFDHSILTYRTVTPIEIYVRTKFASTIYSQYVQPNIMATPKPS